MVADHNDAKPRRTECSSFSSPIRGSEHDTVSDVMDKQKARHNVLYHPLSSPLKGQDHIWQNHGDTINRRNKHTKSKEIRANNKFETLMKFRELTSDKQAIRDYQTRHDREASELFSENVQDQILKDGLDSPHEFLTSPWDDLGGPMSDEQIAQFELEEFLRTDQEELEQLVANMEL